MHRSEALSRLARARCGHLATVRPNGDPHVVVVTFAVSGGAVLTAIDHKPKRSDRLQRLTNVRANGSASLLVDHYDEDWSRLWWVRVDGPALVWDSGDSWTGAIDALVAKYDQYRQRRPEGPVIAISLERVSSWESTP